MFNIKKSNKKNLNYLKAHYLNSNNVPKWFPEWLDWVSGHNTAVYCDTVKTQVNLEHFDMNFPACLDKKNILFMGGLKVFTQSGSHPGRKMILTGLGKMLSEETRKPESIICQSLNWSYQWRWFNNLTTHSLCPKAHNSADTDWSCMNHVSHTCIADAGYVYQVSQGTVTNCGSSWTETIQLYYDSYLSLFVLKATETSQFVSMTNRLMDKFL